MSTMMDLFSPDLKQEFLVRMAHPHTSYSLGRPETSTCEGRAAPEEPEELQCRRHGLLDMSASVAGRHSWLLQRAELRSIATSMQAIGG
jgi:hypothetical protein